MVAFHDSSVQNGVVDDAAIKRLFKELGQLLLVHLYAHRAQALDDLLVFHSTGPPMKRFPDLLALFVHDDLSDAVYFNDVVTLRHAGDPFAFLELLLHPRHGPLLPELVVELGEEKLNVLVQHPAWVGGIGWLRYRKDAHAVLLPQVLGELDGPSARAREAVKGVHQDVRHFAPMLFDELQHPQELFSPVGLGRFISASKVSENGEALLYGVLLDDPPLKVEGEVGVGLFLGRDAGVDHGVLGVIVNYVKGGGVSELFESVKTHAALFLEGLDRGSAILITGTGFSFKDIIC